MSEKPVNLTTESMDVAGLVKARNCYRIGSWSLLYNEKKNQATFEFDDVKPSVVRISISKSTGWVRLLRPVDVQEISGVYSISLVFGALTVDPKSKYTPYVFVCRKAGSFEKHSKLTKCDDGYKTNLHISENSPTFWIGIETVEPNIELLLDHIQLEIVEHIVEVTENMGDRKNIDLPLVMSESKSPRYQAIKSLNEDYLTTISEDELPFLLNYAMSLDRVQMSDTFLRLIRYLVVKYSNLDDQYKAMLAVQVRNALVISHDKLLVELILTNCPEMLPALDLSEEIFSKLSGLEIAEFYNGDHELDKHAYFMFQKQPIFLLRLIRKKLIENPEYLHENPEAYCAFANACASNISCQMQYMAYFNRYLAHHGLPTLESVNTNDKQGLSGFRFAKNEATIDKGPLVSVLMSAHEADTTIGYAIESLLNQTYQNIEILICDDQSDDTTLVIAHQCALKDDRVRVFQSDKNQGTYNIRNKLIKEAKGEFLTFHDSDDFALPCRIEEQLKMLAEERNMVCFSKWLRISEEGRIVYYADGHCSRFCVVSAMAHHSLFERLPPFRSALVAADTEFHELCKYLLGEECISIIERPLIIGLWGRGSLTNRENLVADYSGYVAPRRRQYAEIAARQRILGDLLVTDDDINEKLQTLQIYRKPVAIRTVPVNHAAETTSDLLAVPGLHSQSNDVLAISEKVRPDTQEKSEAKSAQNVAA